MLSPFPIVPSAGVALERALTPHIAVELFVDGAASRSAYFSQVLRGSLGLGIKWYAKRAFDGLWLGAHLPVSVLFSQAQITVVDAQTNTSSEVTVSQAGIAISPDISIGYSARLADRFLVSLSAGPAASWSRYDGSPGALSTQTPALSFGLRTTLTAGFVF